MFSHTGVNHPTLYTLLTDDSDGVGQPVAFCLLAREDQAISYFFVSLFCRV